MAEYAWTVVARKPHWCDAPGYRDHRIPAGAPYARCAAFPDGDINNSDRPWTVKICADCWTDGGDPMPPPRTRKRRAPKP